MNLNLHRPTGEIRCRDAASDNQHGERLARLQQPRAHLGRRRNTDERQPEDGEPEAHELRRQRRARGCQRRAAGNYAHSFLYLSN